MVSRSEIIYPNVKSVVLFINLYIYTRGGAKREALSYIIVNLFYRFIYFILLYYLGKKLPLTLGWLDFVSTNFKNMKLKI